MATATCKSPCRLADKIFPWSKGLSFLVFVEKSKFMLWIYFARGVCDCRYKGCFDGSYGSFLFVAV